MISFKQASFLLFIVAVVAVTILSMTMTMTTRIQAAPSASSSVSLSVDTYGNRVATKGNYEFSLDSSNVFKIRDKRSSSSSWQEWCYTSASGQYEDLLNVCRMLGVPLANSNAIFLSTYYRSSNANQRSITCPANWTSFDECTFTTSCSTTSVARVYCSGPLMPSIDFNFSIEPNSGRVLVGEVVTPVATIPPSTLCDTFSSISSSRFPDVSSFRGQYFAKKICRDAGYVWDTNSYTFDATSAYSQETLKYIDASARAPNAWNMAYCNTTAYTIPVNDTTTPRFTDNCIIGGAPGASKCPQNHNEDSFVKCHGSLRPMYDNITLDSNGFVKIHVTNSLTGMKKESFLCDSSSTVRNAEAEAVCYFLHRDSKRSKGAQAIRANVPPSYNAPWNGAWISGLNDKFPSPNSVDDFTVYHDFDITQTCNPNNSSNIVKILCPTVDDDFDIKRDVNGYIMMRLKSFASHTSPVIPWRPLVDWSTPSTNTQKFICAKLGEPTNYTYSAKNQLIIPTDSNMPVSYYDDLNCPAPDMMNAATNNVADNCTMKAYSSSYLRTYYARSVYCSETPVDTTPSKYSSELKWIDGVAPSTTVPEAKILTARNYNYLPRFAFDTNSITGNLSRDLCMIMSVDGKTVPTAPYFYASSQPDRTIATSLPIGIGTGITCTNGLDNISDFSTECSFGFKTNGYATSNNFNNDNQAWFSCGNTDPRELKTMGVKRIIHFRPNSSAMFSPVCGVASTSSTAISGACNAAFGLNNITSALSSMTSMSLDPSMQMMNYPTATNLKFFAPGDAGKYTYTYPSLNTGCSYGYSLTCVQYGQLEYRFEDPTSSLPRLQMRHHSNNEWSYVTVSSTSTFINLKADPDVAKSFCMMLGKPTGFTDLQLGDYVDNNSVIIYSLACSSPTGDVFFDAACSGSFSFTSPSSQRLSVHLVCRTAPPAYKLEFKRGPQDTVMMRQYETESFQYFCSRNTYTQTSLKNLCARTGQPSSIANVYSRIIAPSGNMGFSGYSCDDVADTNCTVQTGTGLCSSTSSYYRMGLVCRGAPTKQWSFRTSPDGLLETRPQGSATTDPWHAVGTSNFNQNTADMICEKYLGAPAGSTNIYSAANRLTSSSQQFGLNFITCPYQSTMLSNCTVQEYPAKISSTDPDPVSLWCNVSPKKYEFYVNESDGGLAMARPALQTGSSSSSAKWYPIANLGTNDAEAICRRLGKPWKAAKVATKCRSDLPRDWLFRSPSFSTSTATKDNVTYVTPIYTSTTCYFTFISCLNPVFVVRRSTRGTVYISKDPSIAPVGVCQYPYSSSYNIGPDAAKMICKHLGKGYTQNPTIGISYENAGPSAEHRGISCPANANDLADCTFTSTSYCSSFLMIGCDGESVPPLQNDPDKNTREFMLAPIDPGSSSVSLTLQAFTRKDSSSSWDNICRYGQNSDNFDKYMCKKTLLPYSSASGSTSAGNSSQPAAFKYLDCPPYANITNPAKDCGYVFNTSFCTSSTQYRMNCRGMMTPELNIQVRVNASNDHLEIKFGATTLSGGASDQWGYVSWVTSGYNNKTASMLCKQMNKPMTRAWMESVYNYDNLYPASNFEFPYETTASSLVCGLDAKSLDDCEVAYALGLSTTNRRRITKLHCEGDLQYEWSFKINATNQALLAKDSASAPWGSVTYYSSFGGSAFTDTTATAMCRMIHKGDGNDYSHSSFFIAGRAFGTMADPSIPFPISDIRCLSVNVSTVEECNYNLGCGQSSASNCHHRYDVGLHCRNEKPTIEYRLVKRTSTSYRVEARTNDQAWEGVCGSISTNTARSFCYTAGLPSTNAYSSTTSVSDPDSLGYSYPYCSSSTRNVNESQCTVREDLYSNCGSPTQLVVYCTGSIVKNWEAKLGDNNQLLLQSGPTASWQTVCPSPTDWSYSTKYTICKNMGLSVSNPQIRTLTGQTPSATINSISCFSSDSLGRISTYCSISTSSTGNCQASQTLALYCIGSAAPSTTMTTGAATSGGGSATAPPGFTPSPSTGVPVPSTPKDEWRIAADHRLEVKRQGQTTWGSVCNRYAGNSFSSDFDSAFPDALCVAKHGSGWHGYVWYNKDKRPADSSLGVQATKIDCTRDSNTNKYTLAGCEASYTSFYDQPTSYCRGHEHDVFIWCTNHVAGYDVKIARDSRLLIKPLGKNIPANLPWGTAGCRVTSWSRNGVTINEETSSVYDSLAQVACRATGRVDVSQARFTKARSTSTYPENLAAYASSIYQCSEGATRINQCRYSLDACSHSSDVFVECGGNENFAAGYFFKLDKTTNLVRVRETGSSVWGTIDASSYTAQTLQTLCGVVAGTPTNNYTVSSSVKVSTTGPTYFGNLNCPNDEFDLSRCTFDRITSTSATVQSSLTCNPVSSGTWKIRLGESNRLEMSHPTSTSGKWATQCSVGMPSDYTVQRLCKFLGYKTDDVVNATAIPITYDGPNMPYYTYLYCNSGDNDLGDCSISNSSSSVYTGGACNGAAIALNCLGKDESPSAAAATGDPTVGGNAPESPESSGAGAAAGGSIGGILAVLLIGAIIFFIYKKKKEDEQKHLEQQQAGGFGGMDAELAAMGGAGGASPYGVPTNQLGAPQSNYAPYPQATSAPGVVPQYQQQQPMMMNNNNMNQFGGGAPPPMQNNAYPQAPPHGGAGGFNNQGGIIL